MRPLKLGAFLPHYEGWMTGETPRFRDIAAMARVVEDVGFDSLWLSDHMMYRMPGVETFGAWECWTLLSALAASTQRVELGTLVTSTSFRNPALLAKMVDGVEEISDGRVILGLGAGSHEAEYQAFGWPWDHRTSRFEEAIQIIHALLRKGQVDFRGEYYMARDCELRPRGPRSQGPPIMIGSFRGPRMLRITARYADEWNLPWRNNLAELVAALPRADVACAEVGRDKATLAKSAALHIDLPSRERFPIKDYLAHMRTTAGAIGGSHEEIAETLRSYAAAGISHAQLWIEPMNAHGFQEFGRVLEILDKG